MSLIINVLRETFTAQSTIGRMIVNGEFYCYTMEDTARPPGIKVPGHTCIPDGIYRATVSRSTRFGREMVMLSNQPNGYEIKRGGIRFTGIRIHGGNDHLDTEGCILAALNVDVGQDRIYGSQESEITDLVRSHYGNPVYFVFTSDQT
jgi:hypothetical protein